MALVRFIDLPAASALTGTEVVPCTQSSTDSQTTTGAISNINSTVTAVTLSSGTAAINCALGNYFTITLGANMTSVTFSNLPAANTGKTLLIKLVQDATGSRTATWPASFKWAGGVAGALSTVANAIDVLAITTFDQGTTWDATLGKAFS